MIREPTEKEKAEFDEVRQAPTGRASMFAPEVLLVRARKGEKQKKKANPRPIIDILKEAIRKLFPNMGDQDIDRIADLARTIRHVEDLDPSILAIAAYLKLAYPGNDNNPIQDQLGSPGSLTYEVLSQPFFIELVVAMLTPKISDITREAVDEAKADIISYYTMFSL